MKIKYSREDIIKAVIKIHQIDIHPEVKKKIFNEILWWITEMGGKYNTKLQSTGAKIIIKEKPNKQEQSKDFNHEHLWNRKGLKEDLMKAKDELEIRKILKKAIGITVSRTEHDLLHKTKENGPNKYKKADVKVYNELGNEINLDDLKEE